MQIGQNVLVTGFGFTRRPATVVDPEMGPFVLVDVPGVGYYACDPVELEPVPGLEVRLDDRTLVGG